MTVVSALVCCANLDCPEAQAPPADPLARDMTVITEARLGGVRREGWPHHHLVAAEFGEGEL